MAARGKGSAVPRCAKTPGRQGAARKKGDGSGPRQAEDDPYRDLRIPEDEQHDPDADEYIWPEFEDDDEDRV